MKESLSVRALDQRLQNVAGKDQILPYRLRVTVANVVVGQMLPPGAVKGGTAMKIRLGESGSRFTPDLGTARRESLAQFIEAFEDSLASGWHGFTGRLIAGPAARPAGVPAPYVMLPYEVKLAFHGKSWHTVKLELGHNEIGDADDPVYLLAGRHRAVVRRCGPFRARTGRGDALRTPDRAEIAGLHGSR